MAVPFLRCEVRLFKKRIRLEMDLTDGRWDLDLLESLVVENSRKSRAFSTLGRGLRGQSSCVSLFRTSANAGKKHLCQDNMSEQAAAAATEASVDKQPALICVASTGDKYRCTVEQAHPGWAESVYGVLSPADKGESNCFRHALLSADATAVVTYNEDLILRTFAV